MTDQSIYYMKRALSLANKGINTVSPNPMVGCVIVKNNQIIGEGYHEKAGEPHAEVIALKKASHYAKGATAYITLEPCCHTGKTPPCTTALINAGIKEVYIATQDPNPLICGKGTALLKQHGINIHYGLCEEEAKKLNKIFFHYIQHKTPFVFAKWAMSLDGKTITHPKDSKQISCELAKQDTHLLRQRVDSILIGAKTAIHDNPLLTARYSTTSIQQTKQPLRLILSSKAILPLDLRLFDNEQNNKTCIVTTQDASLDHIKKLENKGINCLFIDTDPNGLINLKSLLIELGKREITSLLIEGGMQTHTHFFQQNLIDEVQVYIAPVIIGEQSIKQKINIVETSQIDRDLKVTASIKERY